MYYFEVLTCYILSIAFSLQRRDKSLHEEIKPEKKKEETNYSQAEPKPQHPKIKHHTHTNQTPEIYQEQTTTSAKTQTP